MSKPCPVCNSIFSVDQSVEIRQQVVCPNCGSELEVVWLYPLELARVANPDTGQAKERKGKIQPKKGIGRVFPAAD